MRLSRESEYGLEGLIFLARQPRGAVRLINEIAEAQRLPQSFLAKIFSKLVRHDLVTSFRGRRRGYALAKPAAEILLKDILEAIEGPGLFDRCVFWRERCSEASPCRLHDRWQEIKLGLESVMERTTLKDLAPREEPRGGRAPGSSPAPPAAGSSPKLAGAARAGSRRSASTAQHPPAAAKLERRLRHGGSAG